MQRRIRCGKCDRDITCRPCEGVGTYFRSSSGNTVREDSRDEAAWKVECVHCSGSGFVPGHWCEPDEDD